MSNDSFFWMGRRIPFHLGESVAAALEAAGVLSFGPSPTGAPHRYFCGIGACQCCLVKVDGAVTEACLTPASADARVERVETADVGD